MKVKTILVLIVLCLVGVLWAANSSTLTSSVDRRNLEPNIKSVWEYVLTYTIEAGGGASEIKQALPLNGILQKIVTVSGDANGISGTYTLAIDDNGDNEIFTSAGPAENAASTFNVWEPLTGTIDIGINPSDDPTAGSDDWTITVTLRGI